ncbi:Recombination endonuclease VII,Ribonuclease H-like domain [Cinara cedri]|uniref:Recombination endonuclease VII,Ribonuclease H-like domain n=1 Tax=Cinara cedri TaxID=506608 RepID=A0A5E4MP95_9HEMI|nr:Recombination endonuclease VII,Ribonuclease H-like domain [Cinara cedri]
MSRLIRSQKTSHTESIVFCKRCFTSFDDRRHTYKLSGMKALEQHKLICGTHKPILPVMPKDGDCVKFNAWGNTDRHPIVIYADFEALLPKKYEEKGGNTRIINNHEAMSYGFLVKASDDVPASLLKEHGIPTGPVIYRRNENKPHVAKHFLGKIVEVGKKIEKLLKTNVPMIMTEDEEKIFSECKECNLCKRAVEGVDKVRDHNHLTGKFRYTLCLGCNLKLQQPKFIPCYFHNLSNYDSH